jgi:iron complex transport system substrate-binding protein
MNEAVRSSERIVSLLPAATEMTFALGLGDRLVGVSHECDFPEEARNRPTVVRPALDLDGLGPAEIDRAVADRLRNKGSLYEVDEQLLTRLSPDLLLAQDLCQVCAPSGNEISKLLTALRPAPEVLWLTPHSVPDIAQNLRDLGRATAADHQCDALLREWQDRMQRVRENSAELGPPVRVACLEWVDPVYCSGHWVPQMVEWAGGFDSSARPGVDSIRIEWSRVVAAQPEVLLVSPCGYHLDAAIRAAEGLRQLPGWNRLPAVRAERVFAVDASSYFSRPGPRVVEGIELLAHLLHPDEFDWKGRSDAYASVSRPS